MKEDEDKQKCWAEPKESSEVRKIRKREERALRNQSRYSGKQKLWAEDGHTKKSCKTKNEIPLQKTVPVDEFFDSKPVQEEKEMSSEEILKEFFKGKKVEK